MVEQVFLNEASLLCGWVRGDLNPKLSRFIVEKHSQNRQKKAFRRK